MPITAQIDGVGNLEFPDGTSPDVVHATVQKVVMQHNAPKPLTGEMGSPNDNGVPDGLQGKEPEYKPFFSSDAARAQGLGLMKAGAGALGMVAHGVDKTGLLDDKEKQGLKDLDTYAQPNNKDEQFGKVSGTMLGALPAIYGGGEFLGGVADELGPALSQTALPAMGRVAGQAAAAATKKLATGALLGAGYEARHKIGDILGKVF